MAVSIILQISPTSQNAWNTRYTVSNGGHQSENGCHILKIYFWIDFIHVF